MELLPTLVLLAVLALPVFLAFHIVPEGQRTVVLRLGHFHRVLKPGLRLLLPGLDQAIRVHLSTTVPGWETLTEADLDGRLGELATTGQLVGPGAR